MRKKREEDSPLPLPLKPLPPLLSMASLSLDDQKRTATHSKTGLVKLTDAWANRSANIGMDLDQDDEHDCIKGSSLWRSVTEQCWLSRSDLLCRVLSSPPTQTSSAAL
jgi:hypothetical protein